MVKRVWLAQQAGHQTNGGRTGSTVCMGDSEIEPLITHTAAEKRALEWPGRAAQSR